MSKCTRLGCLKEYKEEENKDGSCVYHDGKPIFHELKKGWTCCNQVVYDWDEFQKLKGCRVGQHTDVKNSFEFFKSQNAQGNSQTENANDIVKNEPKPVIIDINEYEKEQKRIADEKKKNEVVNTEPLKNGEGKLYCSNAGCTLKVYKEEENNDIACKYHEGKPVFHDLKKYWTCCKTETWDWDEFMKLPTCAVGKHQPKFK